MPELPEVEVTRRGIASYLLQAQILSAEFSDKPLRWSTSAHPLPPWRHSAQPLPMLSVGRRGKYLFIETNLGWILIHLGMSGRLQLVDDLLPRGKNDHFDLRVRHHSGAVRRLRLTDPRRFGAVMWHDRQQGALEEHVLLKKLGIEPLSAEFSGAHLYRGFRGRTTAVKQALLVGSVVVGVGNIYAAESLFHAGIRPQTSVGKLSLARCTKLASAIQAVLSAAIERGGSTLRDFLGSDGKPGYFQQEYFVYGRAGAACRVCGATIRSLKQGQRSSFYCPNCQR